MSRCSSGSVSGLGSRPTNVRFSLPSAHVVGGFERRRGAGSLPEVSLRLSLPGVDFDHYQRPNMTVEKARLVPSTRLGLALLGFVGCMVIYSLRVNLSVALVCMVNQTYVAQLSEPKNATLVQLVELDSQCVREPKVSNETEEISLSDQGEHLWTKDTQGLILGAFFWGYALTQVPGGWMAQQYGARRVMAATVALSVIVTLVTPLGASIHYSVVVILRVILGFCQGVTFPAFHAMWSHWAPPLERSLLTGVHYAGNQVGNVLTLPLSGLLCDYGFAGGWPSIFYVLALAAAGWVVLWWFLMTDLPTNHPRISTNEREYIVQSLAHQVVESEKEQAKLSVPWSKVFTSWPVLAAVVGHFAGDFGAYTMLTCLPSFMKDVLKFDMTQLGFLASIPYVAYFICINLGGIFADLIRTKGILSTLNTRRLAMIVALGSQAVFLVWSGYCTCGQEGLVIILLTLGMGLSGFQYAGFIVNYMDIAPAFAGPILGIGNTLSCLGGIAAPYLMGLLTPDKTRLQWLRLFWLTAGILVSGTVFFCIFAAGEVQPWARVEVEGEEMKELKKEEESEENGLKAPTKELSTTPLVA